MITLALKIAKKSMMTTEKLLGLDDTAVTFSDFFNVHLCVGVDRALHDLYLDAEQAGFVLSVASGYRHFSRQLLIWNQKASGSRMVLDSNGQPMNMTTLNDDEKLWAILRWSALPGSSRHHWGTDVDVYDRSKIDANYQLQLTMQEIQVGGPFAEFHLWLTEKLAEKNCPFFRPYVRDRGGVAPEPWHLSYAPIANEYAAQMSVNLLREQMIKTNIELKESILQNLDEIFERFITIK